MEYLSAGTTFKIGSTAITGCYSTPDFGSEPGKIDVTSFDDTKYKRYIQGLIDAPSLNFDFYKQENNFESASSAESETETTYTLDFPDGSGYTFKGQHRTYMLATKPEEPLKFRVSVTVSGEITTKSSS